MAADDLRPNATGQRSPRVALAIAGVAVLALIIGAWAWIAAGRESTDDAQIDGRITPIGAKVGGAVLEVSVRDNQVVQAGDVLVRLDPREYQIAVDRAEAELADAEANARAATVGVPIASAETSGDVASAEGAVGRTTGAVEAAERQVEAANAGLNAARARARERQADADRAARDLDRLEGLIVKKEISRQQYEAAEATATAALAARDAAEAAAVEAEVAVRVAESRLVQARGSAAEAAADLASSRTAPEQMEVTRALAAAAEARVRQAKAALAQAQLNLEFTVRQAPTDGILSKKAVEVGQIVQPGQPLMAIVSLDEVWVTANFKETQLREMAPGQPVTIEVDAFRDRSYSGTVESIAPATGARFSLLPPENATGNYVKVVQRIPVTITFDEGQDAEHLLRPGMSVVPTVHVR
jgi:membrane fusion protein (multidrug efflux system)